MKKQILMIAALLPSLAIANPSYEIIKDDKVKGIKRSVEIVLTERVSEKELEKLAREIHKPGFKNTFIGYRVTGDDPTSAYWATTNFQPDLKVNIIGSTLEEHRTLNDYQKPIPTEGEEIIGTWRANWGLEYKMIFKIKDGIKTVESIYSDGSKGEEELLTETIEGKQRYYTESSKDHDEFFLINESGDLEFWSPNGNFYTAKKEFF